MEHSIIISNIITSMREFQKENNIKGHCITNTQYLYDFIKMNINNANAKAKAVLVISVDIELDTCFTTSGHLVVVLDDELIIDPSYDVYSLKNKTYFHNIKDLMSFVKDNDKFKSKVDIKQLIDHHIHFTKLAETINNGECLITEKKFYNNQADYIEKLYSMLPVTL